MDRVITANFDRQLEQVIATCKSVERLTGIADSVRAFELVDWSKLFSVDLTALSNDLAAISRLWTYPSNVSRLDSDSFGPGGCGPRRVRLIFLVWQAHQQLRSSVGSRSERRKLLAAVSLFILRLLLSLLQRFWAAALSLRPANVVTIPRATRILLAQIEWYVVHGSRPPRVDLPPPMTNGSWPERAPA